MIGGPALLNGDVHAVLMKPDGDCDDDCEAKMAAAQKNIIVPMQKTSTTNTALRESAPTTLLERLHNRMRQRYRLPSQR